MARRARASCPFFFRDGPGLILDDVFIDGAEQGPEGLQGARELVGIEEAVVLGDGLLGELGDGSLGGSVGDGGAGIGNLSVEVTLDHRESAAGKVAEAVGEIAVEALHESVEGERAVLSEDDLAEEEVAQSVGTENFEDGFAAHDVAARLGHLALFKEQPAVGDDLAGQRQSGGEQEGRPIDAVEAHDLFADHVYVGGPVMPESLLILSVGRAEAYGGDVVAERVEPDVDDVRGIAGDGDAPGKSGAGDGEIAQAAFDERDDFVAARLGIDEVGIFFVELEKRLGHVGELEEIILLLNGFGDASADRAGCAGSVVVGVEFVEDAILAGVGTFVDEAALLEQGEHGLHAALVLWAGGANEFVVADSHAIPEGAEFGADLVGELLGAFAGGGGGALDLLAVLVGSGEEVACHGPTCAGGGQWHRRRRWCRCGRCEAAR